MVVLRTLRAVHRARTGSSPENSRFFFERTHATRLRLGTLGKPHIHPFQQALGRFALLLSNIRGTFGTFNRAEFWRFQKAGAICQTDRIAIFAEKISPESRRAEG